MHDKLIGPNRRAQVDQASGSGTFTLVAAIAGKRIALIHYCLSVDAAVNLTFLSGSTEIGGPLFFPAGSAGECDHDEDGMMITASGEALNIARSAASAVGGYIRYKVLG